MNVRLRALERAQRKVGVREVPMGSNRGPYVSKWLRAARADVPNPWCGAFLYSMFLEAESDAVKLIPYPAAVLSWVTTAAGHGWEVSRPFRGDAVAYSWHGADPDPDDHIGIVEKVLALPWPRNGHRYWIRTVEGNTGDAVRRRWRWVNPNSVAFIRIPD